jgi:hypothetical protein
VSSREDQCPAFLSSSEQGSRTWLTRCRRSRSIAADLVDELAEQRKWIEAAIVAAQLLGEDPLPSSLVRLIEEHLTKCRQLRALL